MNLNKKNKLLKTIFKGKINSSKYVDLEKNNSYKIVSENELEEYMKNNRLYIKLFYTFQDKRLFLRCGSSLRKKVSNNNNDDDCYDLECYIKKYIIDISNNLRVNEMNLTKIERLISWKVLKYNVEGYKNINLKVILIKSWIKNCNNKKWVVIVHGMNSHKFKSIFFGLIYLRLGYNIVVFDQRNHGESSKCLTTMGEYEKEDLASVIDFLNEHEYNDISEINFHGWSMGTIVIMEYLKKYSNSNRINKNLGWLVLDSPISRLNDLYRYFMSKLHFNYYEHYYAICRYAIDKRGYDPNKLNPGEGLDSLSRIPALFILNLKDKITPYVMGEEAFNNKLCSEKTKISKKIIFECDHVRGIYYDQKRYINEIKEFIKNIENKK